MMLVIPPLELPDVTMLVTGLPIKLNGLAGCDTLAIEPAAGETGALVPCGTEPEGCMLRESKCLACVFVGSARITSSHCIRAASI